MIAGSRTIKKPIEEVSERLRMMLAAANCSVSDGDGNEVRFKHGTYLTQSAPLLPKSGTICLGTSSSGTNISYEIRVSGFARVWMILVAVLTCWAIFPPILVYRALAVHPRRFMDNLLEGL